MKTKVPPPDPNVGLAQRQQAEIARMAEDRAQQNDAYFRQNFAPRYLEQMDQQISMGKELQDYTLGLSKKYDQRYWDTTAKQQDRFYQEVDQYDTGAERDRIAGRAMSDIEQQSSAGNLALQRGLARRGVNPGSAAYMSMMGDNQRATSLAKASAATMAQEAARREGLNLRGVAAGMGGNLTGAAQGWSGQTQGAATLGMQGIQGAQQGSNSNTNAWNSTMGLAGGMYNNVGNLGMQQWQTKANINAQNANMFNNMLGTAAGFGASYLMFSDRRLKTDIERVGRLDSGLPVYKYRYKAGGPVHIGVMAQDVAKVKPDAVVKKVDGKHHAVDYSAL